MATRRIRPPTALRQILRQMGRAWLGEAWRGGVGDRIPAALVLPVAIAIISHSPPKPHPPLALAAASPCRGAAAAAGGRREAKCLTEAIRPTPDPGFLVIA